LPIHVQTTSSLIGGVDSAVFVIEKNDKFFSSERPVEFRIGWLSLFLIDLFGFRWGAIFFVKSSLSSLFLLLLAGNFFSPLFASENSGMF
jgi:hypothetical protein